MNNPVLPKLDFTECQKFPKVWKIMAELLRVSKFEMFLVYSLTFISICHFQYTFWVKQLIRVGNSHLHDTILLYLLLTSMNKFSLTLSALIHCRPKFLSRFFLKRKIQDTKKIQKKIQKRMWKENIGLKLVNLLVLLVTLNKYLPSGIWAFQ